MKVLGILGSPRRNGNTEILLDQFLEGAREAKATVEKIVLNELNFRACQECSGCRKTGICVLDDELKQFYPKILDSQIIVIASPIFFGSPTAQIKAVIDRCQCLWVVKYILKKKLKDKKAAGFFISVGGMKRTDFFKSAESLVKIFFAITDTDYKGKLIYSGVDKKGQIKEVKGALKSARESGKNIVKSFV
ncbi:hypothetical protein B9J78_02270 [bacterium Unc6]|nr:hypothetical protein [bacterium Unc6]